MKWTPSLRIQGGKLFWEVAIFGAPLAIGMGLQNLFNLVDAYLVGRLPKAEVASAIGAIGMCDLLAAIGTIVCYGISTATSTIIAQRVGAKDHTGVERAMWQSTLLVGIVAMVFAIFAIVFAGPLITYVMGAKGAVRTLATSYLRVLVGGSGTRSGSPILFPFPNRIAGAAFEWDGQTYHLEPSHPGDPNAIHGFCAKTAWSDFAATAESAVTGTFRLSRDAPAGAARWPGDLELRVTFELLDHAMRVTARVSNPSDHAVPFGLGYHPYFTTLGATELADTEVQVSAGSYWQLHDSIPDGTVAPVAGDRDLQVLVPIGDRVLDDVLTGLSPFRPDGDGLMQRAQLRGPKVGLLMRYDASFRDVVVFTPANREAIAIEPYTCPTDAVHLQALGHDVGWRSLAPGSEWTGVVEYHVVLS